MENAGGEGVRGVSGEGRMDWKEGKERQRETAIIVGKDGGWMLSFGDASSFMSLDSRGSANVTPSRAEFVCSNAYEDV